ncbi:MAG TPA: 50S ribosomal protein L25 [bacterium]|nr:50S ribosomal protein L25 [bacterium]
MKLHAQIKTETGKGANRQFRRSGLVPAVLYGKQQDPIPLTLDQHDVERILAKGGGRRIQDMIIQGLGDSDKETLVMFKDIQRDPISGDLIHLDFYSIRSGQQLTLEVPIILTGEAQGVTEDGGALQFLTRAMEIQCLPKDLPEYITVDISALGIGDSISLGDVELPAGVTLTDEPAKTIASVVVISAPALDEEEAEGGEQPLESSESAADGTDAE